MAQGAKVLITDDARFDLEAYRWDDNRFSDILIRGNPIAPEQAMHISRFIRQEIAKARRAGEDQAERDRTANKPQQCCPNRFHYAFNPTCLLFF